MEIDKALKAKLESEGYKQICYVEGKGICALFGFIYTVGLVTDLDEHSYKDRYCYKHANTPQAILALYQWERSKEGVVGDPEDGYWIKRKGKEEYSNPNPSVSNCDFFCKESISINGKGKCEKQCNNCITSENTEYTDTNGHDGICC